MASGKETPVRPALDPETVEPRRGTVYPEAFKGIVAGREKRALGNALGLSNFGVNLVRLAPGAASAQRHWHTRQDEFVLVLEGEAVLRTDAGDQRLGPGMAAGFPAGVEDGHHLVNESDRDVVYLEVGDRVPGDGAHYPDIDLVAEPDGKGGYSFFKRDGTPY